jgi:hypothetical protein
VDLLVLAQQVAVVQEPQDLMQLQLLEEQEEQD